MPDTYDAPAIIHPTQAEFAATTFNLGSKSAKAALVWSTLRAGTLDELNALFKKGGTKEQVAFIDALHAEPQQVRQLAENLAETFAAITDDGVEGQGLAAAALIKANVTPVVTLHIPLGADNHEDSGLYDEWFQHTDQFR